MVTAAAGVHILARPAKHVYGPRVVARLAAALFVLGLALPATAAPKPPVTWDKVTAVDRAGSDFGRRLRAMLLREARRAKWKAGGGRPTPIRVSTKLRTLIEIVDEDGPNSVGSATARAVVHTGGACPARLELSARARGRLGGPGSVEEKVLAKLARRIVSELAGGSFISCGP
ncbi:MAG: hypothetical protein HY908_33250 [Myxococcales bacterium]|nr:hypothetical protein [Myxococcales bacterium]